MTNNQSWSPAALAPIVGVVVQPRLVLAPLVGSTATIVGLAPSTEDEIVMWFFAVFGL